MSDHLHDQLIRLGDMMGDGLHHEPDGRWIEKEYRRVAKALGYTKPRANNRDQINAAMAKAVESAQCKECGEGLRQTRSGAMRAVCVSCGTKYQFKRKRKG